MFEGVIYKITGKCGKVYIGSTTDYHNRKNNHNCNGNCSASRKLVKPLQFEKIRTDNYNLIKTMLLVEQYYIDIYKCVNIKRAYHNRYTRRKYQKEYSKTYYQNNKEEYKRNQTFRYENNKQKYQDYYQKNKEEYKQKNKISYENNKEERKKRYQNNKEEILKNQKVKINCPYCNSLVSTGNLPKHKKSKKCLKFQTGINSFN